MNCTQCGKPARQAEIDGVFYVRCRECIKAVCQANIRQALRESLADAKASLRDCLRAEHVWDDAPAALLAEFSAATCQLPEEIARTEALLAEPVLLEGPTLALLRDAATSQRARSTALNKLVLTLDATREESNHKLRETLKESAIKLHGDCLTMIMVAAYHMPPEDAERVKEAVRTARAAVRKVLTRRAMHTLLAAHVEMMAAMKAALELAKALDAESTA